MGSSSTNWAARVMSGLPPIRDRIADIPDWQLRAMSGSAAAIAKPVHVSAGSA